MKFVFLIAIFLSTALNASSSDRIYAKLTKYYEGNKLNSKKMASFYLKLAKDKQDVEFIKSKLSNLDFSKTKMELIGDNLYYTDGKKSYLIQPQDDGSLKIDKNIINLNAKTDTFRSAYSKVSATINKTNSVGLDLLYSTAYADITEEPETIRLTLNALSSYYYKWDWVPFVDNSFDVTSLNPDYRDIEYQGLQDRYCELSKVEEENFLSKFSGAKKNDLLNGHYKEPNDQPNWFLKEVLVGYPENIEQFRKSNHLNTESDDEVYLKMLEAEIKYVAELKLKMHQNRSKLFSSTFELMNDMKKNIKNKSAQIDSGKSDNTVNLNCASLSQDVDKSMCNTIDKTVSCLNSSLKLRRTYYIKRQAEKSCGANLFASQINIDNLEGLKTREAIIRAHKDKSRINKDQITKEDLAKILSANKKFACVQALRYALDNESNIYCDAKNRSIIMTNETMQSSESYKVCETMKVCYKFLKYSDIGTLSTEPQADGVPEKCYSTDPQFSGGAR